MHADPTVVDPPEAQTYAPRTRLPGYWIVAATALICLAWIAWDLAPMLYGRKRAIATTIAVATPGRSWSEVEKELHDRGLHAYIVINGGGGLNYGVVEPRRPLLHKGYWALRKRFRSILEPTTPWNTQSAAHVHLDRGNIVTAAHESTREDASTTTIAVTVY